MASIIFLKGGRLHIEKALENMNWDTAKFESELTMFANTQPSRTQYWLWKQYVKWMQEYGVPMQLTQTFEPVRQESF